MSHHRTFNVSCGNKSCELRRAEPPKIRRPLRGRAFEIFVNDTRECRPYAVLRQQLNPFDLTSHPCATEFVLNAIVFAILRFIFRVRFVLFIKLLFRSDIRSVRVFRVVSCGDPVSLLAFKYDCICSFYCFVCVCVCILDQYSPLFFLRFL